MNSLRLELPTALHRTARILLDRLVQLEARVRDGDEAAWPMYLEIARVLVVVAPQIDVAHRGELLTTQEMAERYGITPKTLLKHKARGAIRPALQRGKLIRWRGDEIVR